MEAKQMADSGLVTESSSLQGVTSVTLPPNPSAYRDAAARSVYVEFDVPAAAGQADGTTAKIYGPTSIFGKKLGITQMPPATGICPVVSKVGREW